MYWLPRLATTIIFFFVFLIPFHRANSSISDARRWTHFTIQNGLPDNRIRHVLEDCDGSLLVITMNSGIFRYDGLQFLPLPINQLLPTYFIQWVIRDDNGRLWIACNYQGIWIYDQGKLYPSEFNSLFNKQHFVTLFKDQQGKIWIDVNRVGLFRCDGQTCENMTQKYNLPGEDIVQIAQRDSLTYLLLFNNWQLFEFSPNQAMPLKLHYASRTQISSFALFNNGPINFQSKDLSITTTGKENEILLLYGFDLNAGRSTILTENAAGSVWFYANKNIHCYQKNRLQSYPIGSSGSCSPYQDRFGALWFATELGLFKHQPADAKTWLLPKPIYADSVRLSNYPSNKFMFQDQSGSLWFTGYDGYLLNINGNQVTAFRFPDSLTAARVTAITQDQNNNFWLGTAQHGVIHWDGKNFKTIFSETDLPRNYITSLCLDSQSRLWIGRMSPLKHLSNTRMNELVNSPNLSQSHVSNQIEVTSLTVDEHETVWLGTMSNTIFYSVNQQFNKIATTTPVANKYFNIQNLCYHENKLWGTANYGVFCFESETNTTQFFRAPEFVDAITEPPLTDHFPWVTGDFYHTNSIYRLKAYQNFKQDPAIPIYNISSVCNDPAGGVWVGSYSVGLFYFDPDTLIRFDDQSSLPSLQIAAIYRDQQNRLWIGTLDQGLFVRDGTGFIQTQTMKALGNSIYTFFEDGQQRLWIGTLDHGLAVIRGDEIKSYQQHLPHPSIWGIGESPTGAIYVALQDASFARFNRGRFEILSRNAILFNQDLRQAFKNRTIDFRKYFLKPDQYISAGLACWDGEKIKHCSVAQGLPGHEVTDIAETVDGRIWVATLNTGIAVLDGDRFRPIVHRELNKLDCLIALEAARDTALWMLSQEGMAHLKKDSIQVWGANSKMVSYHAYDIHTNRNNQLLFSDENHLYYFNHGDIQRMPYSFDNDAKVPGIMPFFHLDNMNRAWLISSENKLIALPIKDVPPIIKIKNCQIGTQIYDESQFYQPIVRGYEDRACAIEFFGYHSSFAASQIKYSYRTVKAGKPIDWSPFSASNRILYSALEPGKSHRFEIRAQTPNGLVSTNSAVLQIVLDQKPFYRQGWFYWMISSLILFAIALYFIQRYYRINQIINQRRFNPYVAGEPILKSELFFGREEIVNKILSILHNNSVMITGERRIGKTSLLLQIKKQLAESHDPRYVFIPIFVDLQGVEQWEFFRALAHDIFDQVGDAIATLPLKFGGQNADYGYREFNSDFRTIIRQVTTQHQRIVKLVLLIDEADAMNQFDQVIHAQLRRIFMQEFSLNFGAIIAGTNYIQSWNRPESPWWNLFTMIELKAFTENDAQQLIQAPVKGIFKFTAEALTRIIEKTQCKPYAIQTLCLNLVNHAFDKRRRTIGEADVLAVFDSLKRQT